VALQELFVKSNRNYNGNEGKYKKWPKGKGKEVLFKTTKG
jgi:hypothetical protein